MRGVKWCAGRLAGVWLGGLAVGLVGCGGGGGGSSTSAVTTQTTGTFASQDVSILVGTSELVKVGHGFVTLDHGVPTAVGLALAAQAVSHLPTPPFDTPAIYGVALPPEAVYTPFTFLAFSYWSGHEPHGTGDIPHFHPLFGMAPPQVPDPPSFALELAPIDPAEVPADHLRTTGPDAVAPGIGVAYQDPSQPQAQPGWDSTGQNYFFYNGHMADIGLGATNSFLLRQEAGREPARSDTIKQPQVYPRPGYYPHRYTVSWDAAHQVHLFVVDQFQQATNVHARRRG
jgi:hypothetical protein